MLTIHRRSGVNSTNEYDDLANNETSSPNTSRPQRNPYLAAHLGLGSDDVDGPLPLALLAESGHLEVHADDRVRFDDIHTKAMKKLATSRAKTTLAKPKSTKAKVTKSPASRPSFKTKDAELPSTKPVSSTLAQATAIQDWSRTKPSKAGINQKKTSVPEADNDHIVVELDSDHDAALIASNTSTRVKRKLESYLHTVPVLHTAALVETDGNSSQPLLSRDVHRNEELPSSVYAEEDLFDNLWGAFPPPEAGDIPDYEHTGDENVAFPNRDNVVVEGTKSAGSASPIAYNEASLDLAAAHPPYSTHQASAGFVLDGSMEDEFDDDPEDSALDDIVIDADMISFSKDENLLLPTQASTLSSSIPATINSDHGGVSNEDVIPDFVFDEEDLSLEDLEDLADLKQPSSTSTSTRLPGLSSSMTPTSTATTNSLSQILAAPHSDNVFPAAAPIEITPLPISAISRPFATPCKPDFTAPLIEPDPLSRLPFPHSILDRSPITGLSSHTLLRTCFRLGAALSTGCAAARANRPVLIELYARVLASERSMETGIQTFVLGDLGRTFGAGRRDTEMSDSKLEKKRPELTVQAVWQGWKGLEPWQYDGGLLCVATNNNNAKDLGEEVRSTNFTGSAEAETDEVKMGRFLGKIERDDVGKGWVFRVSNAWEASWEDLEWTRGIYC